jgi:hypothetical protein
MISLPCTSCKKVLEIDDAFAGGVCRCQFCGTIQTVPASLKRGARPGGPITTSTAGPKTLYQKKGLSNPPPPPPAAMAPSTTSTADTAAEPAAKTLRAEQPAVASAPAVDRKRMWMIGVAIGAVAALLIGVITWIAS